MLAAVISLSLCHPPFLLAEMCIRDRDEAEKEIQTYLTGEREGI